MKPFYFAATALVSLAASTPCLANATPINTPPQTCQSERRLEGRYLVSATLFIDQAAKIFTYSENYEPLFPQWPPAGESRSGSILQDGDVTKFTDTQGNVITAQKKRTAFSNETVFDFLGYTFINCELPYEAKKK